MFTGYKQDLPDFLITTMPSKEVIPQSMEDILTCGKINTKNDD